MVEMLLATALCSVLLAALWMLMSTYGELFDKGQQQVEGSTAQRHGLTIGQQLVFKWTQLEPAKAQHGRALAWL